MSKHAVLGSLGRPAPKPGFVRCKAAPAREVRDD
jgi:hypothetical protein